MPSSTMPTLGFGVNSHHASVAVPHIQTPRQIIHVALKPPCLNPTSGDSESRRCCSRFNKAELFIWSIVK